MKKNISKIILGIIFSTIIISCVSYNSQLAKGEGGIEQARKNIIIDFVNTYQTPRSYLKERNGASFNVFWAVKKEVLDEDVYGFAISPENNGYITLGVNDSLGKVPNSYFPNKFEVRKGKLFVWKDSITPLRKDILSVMDRFKVLDSISVKKELGLLPEDFEDTRMVTIDDGLKGVHYYVCKGDIGKYKKVVTNRAFGYYDPPNLRCNNQ